MKGGFLLLSVPDKRGFLISRRGGGGRFKHYVKLNKPGVEISVRGRCALRLVETFWLVETFGSG